MRIHSSSLIFSPTNLNQKTDRNNSKQNNELNNAKQAPGKSTNQTSTPDEIKQTLKNTGIEVDFTNNSLIKPTDSRTLRALSAYTREFNAPLQDQRTQLITGIDFYA